MLPYLVSRSSQLNQEFAILPTAPPHSEGGVFELRTYQLNPGTLLQWEQTWCGRSLSILMGFARSPCHPFCHVAKLGARVSRLAGDSWNQWVRGSHRSGDCTRSITCGNTRTYTEQCPLSPNLMVSWLLSDLQTRKETREKAWKLDGWAETVSKVQWHFLVR